MAPLARAVMVTGCSRGLGLEFVRQLAAAENPPKVIIATCRNPDKATELQALAQNHRQIKIVKFDVVDYDSLPRVVNEVKTAVGDTGLNLLVNNAGIMETRSDTQEPTVPLEKLEPHIIRNVMETNTIAPLMLIKALIPQLRMAAAAGGPIGASRAMVVNISSILGSMGDFKPKPGIYAYRSSKAALNMITKTLAEYSEAKGMMYVAMHPGWVSTDMGSSAAPLTPAESVSKMLHVFGNVKEKDNGVMLSYDGSVLQW